MLKISPRTTAELLGVSVLAALSIGCGGTGERTTISPSIEPGTYARNENFSLIEGQSTIDRNPQFESLSGLIPKDFTLEKNAQGQWSVDGSTFTPDKNNPYALSNLVTENPGKQTEYSLKNTFVFEPGISQGLWQVTVDFKTTELADIVWTARFSKK